MACILTYKARGHSTLYSDGIECVWNSTRESHRLVTLSFMAGDAVDFRRIIDVLDLSNDRLLPRFETLLSMWRILLYATIIGGRGRILSIRTVGRERHLSCPLTEEARGYGRSKRT